VASAEQLKVRLSQIKDENVSLLSEIFFNQRKAKTQLEVVRIFGTLTELNFFFFFFVKFAYERTPY